jgi:hypothetical protein
MGVIRGGAVRADNPHPHAHLHPHSIRVADGHVLPDCDGAQRAGGHGNPAARCFRYRVSALDFHADCRVDPGIGGDLGGIRRDSIRDRSIVCSRPCHGGRSGGYDGPDGARTHGDARPAVGVRYARRGRDGDSARDEGRDRHSDSGGAGKGDWRRILGMVGRRGSSAGGNRGSAARVGAEAQGREARAGGGTLSEA